MRERESYGADLWAIYEKWYKKWGKKLEETHDEKTIKRAEKELLDALEEAAAAALLAAFLLGAAISAAEITTEQQRIIDGMLEENHDFLVESFFPDLEMEMEDADWEGLEDVLGGMERRVKLYTQPFWTIIWEGLRSVSKNERPTWVLHPESQHCNQCPAYAKQYPSWDAMIRATGGLPGFSDAECGPGCTCEVIV